MNDIRGQEAQVRVDRCHGKGKALPPGKKKEITAYLYHRSLAFVVTVSKKKRKNVRASGKKDTKK